MRQFSDLNRPLGPISLQVLFRVSLGLQTVGTMALVGYLLYGLLGYGGGVGAGLPPLLSPLGGSVPLAIALIILICGTWGVTIVLGFFTSRQITQGIDQVIQASQTLAAGQMPPPLPRGSMIGDLDRLAQSFQQMATAVDLYQVQTQDNLAALEEKFTLLFHYSPIPTWIATLEEGRCLLVNDSFCQLMGYAQAEIIGQTCRQLQFWDNLVDYQNFRHGLTTQGQVRDFECVFRTQSGGTKTLLLTAQVSCLEGQDCILGIAHDISDRKQAELALRDSEMRLQALLANTPGMIYRYLPIDDGGGTFLEVSAGAYELLGLEPEQVRQDVSTVWALIHPEDVLTLQDSVEIAVRDCTDWHWEGRLTTPSGELKWLRGYSRPYVTPAGIVWDGLFTDITALKQTEISLHQEVSRRRSLFETSIDGIVIVDRAGNVLESNARFANMLGYSLEEVKTLNLVDFDVNLSSVEIEGKIDKDELCLDHFESRHRRKDGSIYAVEISANTINWGDQSVSLCICRDITERKRNELALQTSQLRLELALDSSGTGTWDWNMETNEVFFSEKSWRAMVGYGADDRFGNTITEWESRIHPEDKAQLEVDIAKHLRGETETYESVHRIRCQDGTYKWNLAQGKVIEWDQAGNPVRFIGLYRDISDRKQTEIALSNLRSQLERAQEIAHLGHWSFDLDTQKLTWSDEVFRIFDMTTDQDEPTFREHLEQIHPDDQSSWLERVAEANQGIPQNFCFRILRPTGEVRYVNSYLELEYEGEQIVRMFGVVMDITEQKQNELALQASEARFRAIFEQAAVGINQADVSGQFIEANQYFCDLLGYTRDELLALTFQAITHPDDFQQDSVFSRLLAGELTSVTAQKRYRHKQGDWIWTEVTVSLIHDADGRAISDLAIVLDISDLKQANAALQASEARFRTIFEQAAAGINQIDASGRFTEANQYYCNLLGYSRAELLTLTFVDVIHPEDLAKHWSEVDRIVRGEIDFLDYERRERHKNGDWIWIKSNISVLRDGAGQVVGNLAVVVDIRDRKQAELALQESQARFQLLSAASPAVIYTVIETAQGINRFDYISPAAEEIHEIPVDTLLQNGMLISEQMHPEDREHYAATYAASLQALAPFTCEWRIITPSGQTKWLRASSCPEQRPDGDIAWHGIALDISTRKQAELESQTLQTALVEAQRIAHIGNWAFDLASQKITWSLELFRMFGLDPAQDEPSYPDYLQLIHPDDRLLLQQAIDRAVTAGTPYSIDYQAQLPDGSTRYHEGRGEVERDCSGQITRLLGTCLDITDRKRVEQIILQQARQEALLREIGQRIRQSLDLQTIFDTACQEIRSCLNADRVGIFKFDPDSGYDDGEFIAEACVGGLPSVLTIPVQDHCFGDNYATLYAQGHYCVIDDIYSANMADCYIDLLAQFQVRATLVMPLFCGDVLWGLLCIHQCNAPRQWQQANIDLGQQLANQLAIAIQQAILYEQLQSELQERQRAETKISQQLQQQTALGMIWQQIRQSLDLQDILAIVTQQVQVVFQCDRVIVFQLFADGRSQIVEEEVLGSLPALRTMHWEDEVWSQDILALYWQGQPRIVPDVMDDIWTDCLVEYAQAGQIKSKIVAPILQQGHTATGNRWQDPNHPHKLWGVLVVHACHERRTWKAEDAQLLQQIANQLAIAIRQAHLFEQLQQELIQRQQAQQQLVERNQELAIANQDLSRATRLKDEFLANMSHELRTPLNVILGFAQVLNSDLSLQPQHQDYIRIMHRSGDHLLHLINDILDLSKIEANRITLEPESIDLFSLLHDLQAMFQERATDKELQFTLALPPDLPQYIVADPNKLRQVLINLLNNAIKFTQQGQVILSVRLQGAEADQQFHLSSSITSSDTPPTPSLCFQVIDTGVGIPSEEIDIIFDAFTQARAGKSTLGSTGLGLAISRSLVKLMGGELTVNSAPDQGSTFQFAIPLHLARGEDVTSEGSLGTVIGLAPGQSPYRILVVDDQPDNRQLLVTVFSQIGLEVQEAASGADAIAANQQWHPHLIWMDLRMPDMDGCEATRQIRAQAQELDSENRPEDPVIIAFTAQASMDERTRALESGCDDFVSKPIQLNLILSKMADYLDLRYEYAQTVTPAPGAQSATATAITLDAQSLRIMPLEWIAALHKAALHCDDQAASSLVQEIPTSQSVLVEGLNRLIYDYKFESIAQLTSPLLLE